MVGLPKEIQRFMLEMQVESIERQRKAVLADPVKHKLTLHFPEKAPMNYRYFKVDKAGFPQVHYCWATGRNLAGYFLGWRETIKRDGSGKRDQWVASKRREVVKMKARDRRDAHQARVKPKPIRPLEERRTTYWISERIPGPQPNCTGSRGLGKIVTSGGPNNALDLARIKWPDAGEIVAIHIGRKG
jgi:hypothetical protein